MNYKQMDLEKLNHLLALGYNLDEIEKMTEVEIEEHCFISEEDELPNQDERDEFSREAIMNK